MPRSARKRLGPTFLTAILITLFHSLTIVSARFHLPIEPLMAIWGAIAFSEIRETVGPPREFTHRPGMSDTFRVRNLSVTKRLD